MAYRTQTKETTWALDKNEIYVGPTLEVLDYEDIAAYAFTDAPGELLIEQSPDDIHWDLVKNVDVRKNSGTGVKMELGLKYARVKFKNKQEDQSKLRLYRSCRGGI